MAQINLFSNSPSQIIVKYSYWKTNPLEVNNLNKNYSQIMSNEQMLIKVNNDINTHKYKLYSKTNDKKITPQIICNFINEYYIESSIEKFKFIYTPDIISYYMNNSITMCFYSSDPIKNPNEKIIGIIIGKKETLVINNKNVDTFEVNFLSTHIKIRNKNLTPLIISMYLRESIEKYSISTAHYTIGYSIKAPSYGKKYFYHRPINILKLIKSEFIDQDFNNLKLINNFKYSLESHTIIYHNSKKNKISNGIINLLYKNIILYNKLNYTIWELKSYEDFEKIFIIDSFHHFIFVSNNTPDIKLKNYICLYKLETINTSNKNIFTNGYFYTGFFQNYIGDIIECTSEYAYNNNIFDVITWSDFFNFKNKTHDNVFLKGTGYLNYYMFNSSIPNISNLSNGMVTI